MSSTLSFNTEAELKEFLIKKDIPIDTWGTYRTLSDLFREISKKEACISIEDPRIVRNVTVVNAIIRSENYVLLQYKQTFRNGETKQRLKLPSEKALMDEDVVVALKRMVNEEVGIETNSEFSFLEKYEKKMEAVAYPGLINKFEFITYDLDVFSLELDMRSEYTEKTERQTTYFKWFTEDYLDKLDT